MLVLYWTGTWWSGVDDERVKEGKRLIFPGFRAPGNQPEVERERKKQRKKKRHGDPSSDGAKVLC